MIRSGRETISPVELLGELQSLGWGNGVNNPFANAENKLLEEKVNQ